MDGDILDVMSGAVDFPFETSTSPLSQIAGGKQRTLTVTTTRRLDALLDLPAVAETVPRFVGDSWHGVFVLEGTPPEVVSRPSAESQKIIAGDDLRVKLRNAGLSLRGGGPNDFASCLTNETRVGSQVVKDNDIRVE